MPVSTSNNKDKAKELIDLIDNSVIEYSELTGCFYFNSPVGAYNLNLQGGLVYSPNDAQLVFRVGEIMDKLVRKARSKVEGNIDEKKY